MEAHPFDITRTVLAPQMGIIADEPETFYHCVPGVVTSSRLKDFRPPLGSPSKWYEKYELGTLEDAPTPAMYFGRAYHALVLEGPGAFYQRFAVCADPIESRAKNPGKQVWDAFKAANAHKEWLFTWDEGRQLKQMQERFRAHPLARALVEQAAGRELTWRGKDVTGLTVQARTDAFGDGSARVNYGQPYLADLKTVSESEWRGFRSNYIKLGYWRQAAFYMAAVEALNGPVKDFYFIAQMKDPPYDVQLWKPHKDDIGLARREIAEDLKALAYCKQHGFWPGAQLLPQEVRLPDRFFEGDPAEPYAEIAKRAKEGHRVDGEVIVRLAALAGTTPEALLEGAR